MVVLSQLPVANGGCVASDTGASGQEELDDFVLNGPLLTITDLHWWGAYGQDPAPALLMRRPGEALPPAFTFAGRLGSTPSAQSPGAFPRSRSGNISAGGDSM